MAVARKAAGLTQQAVADRVLPPSPDGTHRRQTIYEWEKELSEPSLTQLARLADLYGVTTDRLLGARGSTEPPAETTRGEDFGHVGEVAGPVDAHERVLGLLAALSARPDVRDRGPDRFAAAVAAFESGLADTQPPAVRRAWRRLITTLEAAGVYDRASVAFEKDIDGEARTRTG